MGAEEFVWGDLSEFEAGEEEEAGGWGEREGGGDVDVCGEAAEADCEEVRH